MMFYLCDKAENIIRMLPTYKCDFAVQELVLNGLYTLNFNIDIKDKWIMDDVEFIIHKDSENKSNFFMYRLINSENNKDKIEYKAIYIAMDELESYSYITDKKPKNIKASQAVNIAIDGTKWELGNIDDSKLKSLNFFYSSPLKALTKVIDVYNVELNFRLKANKNKIVKRLIDVKSKIGSFTGKRFFYGSNALEVIQETNTSGIYTKFIPRGRGEEVGDGYGRRIDIKDVVWSKADGDPMDKPKGQEFIEFEDMTALYGHSDGTARHTVVNFDNIDDPEELIKEAYSYGKVNSRPQVSYRSDVTRVGRIGLGDGVLIIRKDLDIRYTARVYKIVRDLKNLNKTQVELGDSRDISQARKNMNFQKRLDNLDEFIGETNLNVVKQIQKGLTESMYNQESYRYESTPGDDSGLLSGTWYFNKPIDQNPDRALYLGGGHIAMANKKDSDGNWEFTTIANGDGVVADVIVAGILKGGKVRWNLEDGTFIIGTSPSNYSLYWDGSTLHLRNVDIDLQNNNTIQNLIEKQGLSEKEIADHKKELQEANAELDKARNDLNLAKNEITNLSNDFTLSNIQQDKTNKTVEEKILDLSTSLNITDEKIESKAESIRKELKNYTNDKERDIKTYLLNNYSSSIQTDQKIENKVGQLKTSISEDIDNLSKEISENESKITQTANEISSRVRENEVISAINQSAEQIKIQANKINLQGDLHLTGTFSNLNSQGQGVSIRNNSLQVYDNAINDNKKTIGQIWPARFSDRQGGRMRLDHFATGLTEINYIKKYTYDDYHHYMVFDIYGYTASHINKEPISVFENMYFANHKKLRFGNWEFVSERDGVLKIKPVDVKAGFLFSHKDSQHKDGFHYYYASGGKDVTKLVQGM